MAKPQAQEWVIWEKQVTPTEKLVVKVVVAKSGEAYLDMRRWFAPDDGSDWLPTKRGLRIHAEQLPEFLSAMHDAAKKIDALYE